MAATEIGERGLPPGPGGSGHAQTLRWMFRPIRLMERARERYGNIFSMRLGPADVVMIADPEAAKEVITGDPRVFRAGDPNGLFRPVVGSNSILLLDGDEHMRHRRILLPAFGAGHAREFATRVQEIAERRVSAWEPGQELRLQDEMEAISFQSILTVVFGRDAAGGPLERLRDLIPEMMDRCDSAFTLIPWFRRDLAGLSPYARLMEVVGRVDDVLYEAIAARREDPMTSLREDVLSLLLKATHEDGSELEPEEIRDEALTMIMAGYETTTSGLAWALERLLRSPHAMQRLRAELEEGGDAYLEAVIKETLRCRSVVPVVARRLSEPAEIAGHLMPAGTTLMVSIYLLHTDPEAYPEPEQFRPERFLDGVPPGAAWIPFGGGVRRCLGASFAQLEMKIVLREVLTAANLRVVSEAAEEPVRKRFTLAPAAGALAVVEDKPVGTVRVPRRRFAPAERPAAPLGTGDASN
jgi:cytochrome P450